MSVASRNSDDSGGISFREAMLQLFCPVLTAILLYASFPPLQWYALAYISLIPLAYVVAAPRIGIEAYVGCYLAGAIFQLLHLDFIRTAYDGTGLHGSLALHWLIQGLVAGVTWLPPLILGRYLKNSLLSSIMLVLPTTWVFAELLRMYAVRWAVDQMGNPWGSIGYSQVGIHQLTQIADVGGVFAVSAVVAIVNGAAFDVLTSRPWFGKRAQVSLAATMAIVAAVWGYGTLRMQQPDAGSGPTVCLISDWNGAQHEKLHGADLLVGTELDSGNKFWNLSFDPVSVDHNDLAPKVARRIRKHDVVSDNRATIERFGEIAARFRTTIVFGYVRYDISTRSIQKYNSLACVDSRSTNLLWYDKLYLVPGTEFAPNSVYASLFGHGHNYTRGKHVPLFSVRSADDRKAWNFAPSICYDNCFPGPYRLAFPSGHANSTPQFFVQLGNEGRDKTGQLHELMLQMAQFRAIETRRALVRHAEDGYSALIDGKGQILNFSYQEESENPLCLGPIPLDTRRSIYVSFGDWPFAVCIGAVVTVAAASHARRKNRSIGIHGNDIG